MYHQPTRPSLPACSIYDPSEKNRLSSGQRSRATSHKRARCDLCVERRYSTERSCPSVPVCLRADAMCERMPGAYNVLVREPLVSSRKRWPCKLTLIDQKHIPVPINGTGKRNSRNGCGRVWLENAKKRVCRSRSARTTHICGCCAWPSWFSLVHPGTIAGGARRRCCHHGTGRRRRA